MEPTLKILKVKFNIEKVDLVMKGEPGVAKKLLYNLKMVSQIFFIFNNKRTTIYEIASPNFYYLSYLEFSSNYNYNFY